MVDNGTGQPRQGTRARNKQHTPTACCIVQNVEFLNECPSIGEIDVMAAALNTGFRDPVILPLIGTCSVNHDIGMQGHQCFFEVRGKAVDDRGTDPRIRSFLLQCFDQLLRLVDATAAHDEFNRRLVQQAAANPSPEVSRRPDDDQSFPVPH